MFIFAPNFATRQFRRLFQIWQCLFQIPAQNNPNKAILVVWGNKEKVSFELCIEKTKWTKRVKKREQKEVNKIYALNDRDSFFKNKFSWLYQME